MQIECNLTRIVMQHALTAAEVDELEMQPSLFVERVRRDNVYARAAARGQK